MWKMRDCQKENDGFINRGTMREIGGSNMGVGRVLWTAQTLLGAVECAEQKEMWSMLGYDSELMKLQRTVTTIKAVLSDADTMQQVLSQEAQLYIDELRDAIFDADDLFDELVTLTEQTRLRSLQGNSLRCSYKVRCLMFHFNYLLRVGKKSSRKVRRVSRKLDEIASNHGKFGFSIKLTDGGMCGHCSNQPCSRRQQTISYVYAADIIGREADVQNIVPLLLDSDHVQDGASFLTIVGAGGIGKTALAQLICNDERISSHFPVRMWTCVSDHEERLDLARILADILESATGRKPPLGSSLDHVQKRLRAHLAGKRFVLVLDDVWCESRNRLIELAGFLTGGQRGSWVLVTTRSHETARLVGDGLKYELEGLSKENSWKLFERMAFKQGKPPDEFVEIDQQIVNKCGNLPLALRVVGSLLYEQPISKWELFQKKWLASVGGSDIVTVLYLSYNHLSPPLRNCFSYCAIFPKNFEIGKETLIGLWMAQGYVTPSESCDRIEDVADDYFFTLLQRCFFHDVKKDEHGEIISVKVHDLMHDMAKMLSEKEICEVNPDTLKVSNAVRHFAVRGHQFMDNLSTKTHVRTYLQASKIGGRLVVENLLANCPSLRTLDLRDAKIEILPNSIGNQLHLRYLDLSFNEKMKALPKAITKLHNLQTLNLVGCRGLKVLPKDLSKLINLRVLDVKDCFLPLYMPRNFGRLNCLHKLDRFGMGDLNPSSGKRFDQLDDLKALVNLKGCIGLQIRSSPSAPYHAKGRAYLSTLEHLSGVEIWYLRSDIPEEDRSKKGMVEDKEFKVEDEDEEAMVKYEEAILEDLRPHSNLTYLRLVEYSGRKLPTWAREHNLATFLPNLVRIEFRECSGLHHLPWLGLLRSLKFLRLEILPDMEYLTDDIQYVSLVPGSSAEPCFLFPCLEHLYLEDLPMLKGWWPRSKAKDGNFQLSSICLPQLRGMWIYECPKISSIPLCPLVDDLRIYDANRSLELKTLDRDTHQKVQLCTASVSEPSHTCNKEMRVSTGNVKLLELVPKENFQCLKEMRIESDYKLESLSEVEDLFKTCLSSLRCLEIWRCPKLRSLSGGLEHLSDLQRLHIRKTAELLLRNDVQTATADNNGGVPWRSIVSTLQSLKLEDVPHLVNLPDGIQHLTSLESLSIVDCKGLMSLPKWLPKLTSLRKLEVRRSHTELKKRCRQGTGVDWLNIQHVHDISITEE